MGSINAQTVAMKVADKVRNGEKVSISKIMRETGYSKYKSAHSDVIHTQSYKTAFELEKQPLLDGLQLQINKAKEALLKKSLKNEEVRTLVGTIDILIKNYQLLSGGATERQVFVLPSEVLARNNIAAKPQDDLSVTM